MSSENQLAALRNWLKQEIPADEDVCEMPGEVCSDALSRLHEASEEYKNDNKKNYGIVLKTKKEIASELREQGWIDLRIGVDDTIELDQDKIREERVRILEAEAIEEEKKAKDRVGHLQNHTIGSEPIANDEQSTSKLKSAQQTVPELIAKFVNLRAQVTESIRNDERIPEREKGYAINWVSDKVADAVENKGGNQEE